MEYKTEIERISQLASEIMHLSYPFCRNESKAISLANAKVNDKAHDILKYISSLETKLKLEGKIDLN